MGFDMRLAGIRFFVVVVVTASSVQAMGASQYDSCMSKAISMPDMFDCTDEQWVREDGRLNRAYKAAMARVDKPADLRSTQRLWIKWRDKKCAEAPDGGQNATLVSKECHLQETARRANELEAM